jgi:1,4-dihydroxy-2-naphthoate octaprenyltransferase
VVAGVPIGALSTNILVVNNVRDVEEDRRAGKRTLAVRFGYGVSRGQYAALLGIGYLAPLYFLVRPAFGPAVLLPLLTLPYAVSVARTVLTETGGDALNPALERTGKLLAGYALLLGAGFAFA